MTTMADATKTPTEIVIEMVEPIYRLQVAFGGHGLPENWRDDLTDNPAPGTYLAAWLYNVTGNKDLSYAARAASLAVRFDYCGFITTGMRKGSDAEDFDELRRKAARIARLLSWIEG